jgi:hypothetical protein
VTIYDQYATSVEAAGGLKTDVKDHELQLYCDRYLPIDSVQVRTLPLLLCLREPLWHALMHGHVPLCMFNRDGAAAVTSV